MRRHHLVAPGAVLLSLAGGFVACSGDSYTPTTPSSVSSSSPTSTEVGLSAFGSIYNNHRHIAFVTGEQIRSGLAVRLDIRGSAAHGHLLDLTNDDITRLRNGQRVDRDSTVDGNHRHRVTFN
jgi:hypothetical protein